MSGLLGLIERVGKNALQLLIGQRANLQTDRAFLGRMCTGAAIIGLLVSLLTLPLKPSMRPSLLGRVPLPVTDWLGLGLLLGLLVGCLLGFLGLWMEGKDVTKV